MKKIFILFFVISVLLIPAFALEANPTVRVGLYYGNNAMPSANLQNVDGYGYGYRFGFYDSTKTFIRQYNDSSTNRISMLKDKNLYYSDGKFYESNPPSGSKLIGAYHLELGTTYKTEAEVNAQLSKIRATGILAFPAIKNNAYRIRIGSYATTDAAKSDISKYSNLGTLTVVGNINKCVTVVNTANGNIILEYDNNTSLAVFPSRGEVSMPLTWFKGYKYHGAFQYMRDGGNITVINFVPMQEYVKGVVPYEMSPQWPLEALKAQAMCARTYAMYNYGKHGKNFDVCNSTDCQVYSGANSANENSNKAVDQTLGMYILYNGKPINAVFHSSDGGATENSENVWSATVPYLRGVYDNNEDLDTCINGKWSYEYTSDELTYILNAKGYPCSKIVNMYVKQYTKMGNVKTLTLVDDTGKEFNFSKEKSRTILYSSTYKKYTHSQRYTVIKKGETPALYVKGNVSTVSTKQPQIHATGTSGTQQIKTTNLSILSASGETTYSSSSNTGTSSNGISFIVSGTGWGHNVGMSQNGAKALALSGKKAEEIINFYYTDVNIYKAK